MEYNFKAVEPKWQEKWEDAGVFHAEDRSDKTKYYALVEFPYPSGAGMQGIQRAGGALAQAPPAGLQRPVPHRV